LAIATGAGAVARRIIGTVVIGGMLAATCIAACLIPVTFYVIEKLAARAREPRPAARPSSADGAAPLGAPSLE
jgi:HAE1 family hydrophobic/amphiphilic exporter-1